MSSNWRQREGGGEDNYALDRYVIEAVQGEDCEFIALFKRQSDLRRVLSDRIACEQFADPVKSVELLMELVKRAKANDIGSDIIGHPALQPPGESQ